MKSTNINIAFLVNPFYLYCISFFLAITIYFWGWSKIFPRLSPVLIIFFISSFIPAIYAGYKLDKKKMLGFTQRKFKPYINDIIFTVIIILGILNVMLMGYIPIFNRSHDYREFGFPVLDPVFNTMSIFFSVFFFQNYLQSKHKRFGAYIIIILIFQILLFRRSSFIWITTSSVLLYVLYSKRIRLVLILGILICIPLVSYFFGLYGNFRSNLPKIFVLDDLGASDRFRNSSINYNHYMTYLYISSPLANLQKNIDDGDGFLNRNDIKDFLFYSLIPESFTLRLEKNFDMNPPSCSLITPDLMVGTFLMVSYATLGWFGMIIMIIFLFIFICFCILLIKRFNTFNMTTYSLLSTTVSLLIFSNFLNRLDVVLMLFIYPSLFHFIYNRSNSELILTHQVE